VSWRYTCVGPRWPLDVIYSWYTSSGRPSERAGLIKYPAGGSRTFAGVLWPQIGLYTSELSLAIPESTVPSVKTDSADHDCSYRDRPDLKMSGGCFG
jgi:hypothetical protein